MAVRDQQLIKAAGKADFRRVTQLIREGAEVNVADRDGCTSLDAALSAVCFFKKTVVKGKIVKSRVRPLLDIQRTVKELLKGAADPNRLRHDFGSPLIIAASDGCMPIIKMLLNAGANPSLQDAVGDTPLRYALRRPAVVRYLLGQGADPRLKNREGKSALDIAKERCRLNPREFGTSYELMQKAPVKPVAKNPQLKSKPARGPKLGIKDFTALMYRGHPEWSLIAVQASVDRVAADFSRLTKASRCEKQVLLKPSRRGEQVAPVSVATGICGNPWTIIFRSLFDVSTEELDSVPNEAKDLSSKLKTKAIYFIFEDTAGAMGYGLYEKGRMLEEADWEVGSALSRFKSTLRDNPGLEHATDDFADETFRWLGIYVPACYPRIEGKRMWLAVDKVSKNTIERADLVY
jgi:hypothetical protein